MIACTEACFDTWKRTDGNAWNEIVVNLTLTPFALNDLSMRLKVAVSHACMATSRRLSLKDVYTSCAIAAWGGDGDD